MDLRTEETMAAYNEYHAAKYFFEKHETTSETPRSPSDRTHYEYYGRNFNKNSTDAEVGYVYADFMDSLQIYTGRGSAFVRADSLIGRYGYFSSHKSNYMKWFNIKDEKTFDDYLKRFCMNSFPKIAEEQVKPEIVQAGKLGSHSVLVSKSSPLAKVTTEKDGLIMRDVEVDAENRKDGSFSAFVIRDKEATEDVMAFCWCKGNYTSLHTDDYYMHTETGERGYRLGYFKYPSGKYKFTVVALFQPEQIKIRKAKEDQITFIVPKAPRALTKEKLITGAVITYKDKNGNEVTRDVKAKDFGRKATWSITGCTKPGNSFSVSMHWYYQADSQTVYKSPESEPVTWGAKDNKPHEEAKPAKEPKTNYWKQVNVRMNKSNTSFKESQDLDEEVSPDYRSIDFVVDKSEKSCDFSGMAATEETSPDGKTRYVSELYMTGTLTYTEPPVFWIPTQQYKARWDIADDPYFMKIKEPFVFEAKNTSSNQAACTQSKKDKIDTGHSTTGKVNWLRSASTTFEARFPEKDGPKFFTLTQTYSIKEREGSDLMATVTFEYDYEWVGEPEEEVKEEETAPEGGYWQLVKTEVDDSRAKRKDSSGTPENKLNPSGKHKHNGYVTGSNGQYTAFTEWWAYADWVVEKGLHHATSYRVVNTWTRDINFTVPKKRYLPEEQIVIDINHSPVSIEGDGETSIGRRLPFGSVFMYSRSVYGDYDETNNWLKTDAYETAYVEGGPTNNTGQVTAHYTSTTLTEKMGNDFLKDFVIIEEVKSAYGDLITKYYYEWVEGEPEDIIVERMTFVTYLYLPESPEVMNFFDFWPRQAYGPNQITTYKEGSGYRAIGVSQMAYGIYFENDPEYPVTYQDRMEITFDKDFNVIRGTYTRDLTHYGEDPFDIRSERGDGKYDKKMHLQFEKSPDDGKSHQYHYKIVSFDASTHITTRKKEHSYVLTTDDLRYYEDESKKDHYIEDGCTLMNCWELAKFAAEKNYNADVDFTIKKQKH